MNPILEYACAVWPCAKANEIDVIQNRAMRYFLGVHTYAPNAGLSGDMGWIKHGYNRYLCAFRFWNRLLNMYDSRLTKHIFKWDYVIKGVGAKILNIFSCDQAALWMVFSVCPSVCLSACLSVCPLHLFEYVPIIVSSWIFQKLSPRTRVTSMQKVKVKGQGHRGHNPT